MQLRASKVIEQIHSFPLACDCRQGKTVPISDLAAFLTHTEACMSHSKVTGYTTELSQEQYSEVTFSGLFGLYMVMLVGAEETSKTLPECLLDIFTYAKLWMETHWKICLDRLKERERDSKCSKLIFYTVFCFSLQSASTNKFSSISLTRKCGPKRVSLSLPITSPMFRLTNSMFWGLEKQRESFPRFPSSPFSASHALPGEQPGIRAHVHSGLRRYCSNCFSWNPFLL